MPSKKAKCMIGNVGMSCCSMVWILGWSADWYAVSQSLCCPYLLTSDLDWFLPVDGLPLEPLDVPFGGFHGCVVGGCGIGWCVGVCVVGIGGGKVWYVVAGYGWYLLVGVQELVLNLDLVLPLPLPLDLPPFSPLGFFLGGWERMSAKVTGSWRISSVACLNAFPRRSSTKRYPRPP